MRNIPRSGSWEWFGGRFSVSAGDERLLNVRLVNKRARSVGW